MDQQPAHVKKTKTHNTASVLDSSSPTALNAYVGNQIPAPSYQNSQTVSRIHMSASVEGAPHPALADNDNNKNASYGGHHPAAPQGDERETKNRQVPWTGMSAPGGQFFSPPLTTVPFSNKNHHTQEEGATGPDPRPPPILPSDDTALSPTVEISAPKDAVKNENKEQETTEDTIITVPRPMDVLCAIGHDSHYGNQLFHAFVQERHADYFDAEERWQKSSLARSIRVKIKEQGGRFLARVEENAEVPTWKEITDYTKIDDKIKNTFRDLTKKKRKRQESKLNKAEKLSRTQSSPTEASFMNGTQPGANVSGGFQHQPQFHHLYHQGQPNYGFPQGQKVMMPMVPVQGNGVAYAPDSSYSQQSYDCTASNAHRPVPAVHSHQQQQQSSQPQMYYHASHIQQQPAMQPNIAAQHVLPQNSVSPHQQPRPFMQQAPQFLQPPPQQPQMAPPQNVTMQQAPQSVQQPQSMQQNIQPQAQMMPQNTNMPHQQPNQSIQLSPQQTARNLQQNYQQQPSSPTALQQTPPPFQLLGHIKEAVAEDSMIDIKTPEECVDKFVFSDCVRSEDYVIENNEIDAKFFLLVEKYARFERCLIQEQQAQQQPVDPRIRPSMVLDIMYGAISRGRFLVKASSKSLEKLGLDAQLKGFWEETASESYLRINHWLDHFIPSSEINKTTDILLGKGQDSNAGNRRLQRLIVSRYDNYAETTKHVHKSVVAQEILKIVQDYGGRFLYKVDGMESGWFELADHKLMEERIKTMFRGVTKKKKTPSSPEEESPAVDPSSECSTSSDSSSAAMVENRFVSIESSTTGSAPSKPAQLAKNAVDPLSDSKRFDMDAAYVLAGLGVATDYFETLPTNAVSIYSPEFKDWRNEYFQRNGHSTLDEFHRAIGNRWPNRILVQPLTPYRHDPAKCRAKGGSTRNNCARCKTFEKELREFKLKLGFEFRKSGFRAVDRQDIKRLLQNSRDEITRQSRIQRSSGRNPTDASRGGGDPDTVSANNDNEDDVDAVPGGLRKNVGYDDDVVMFQHPQPHVVPVVHVPFATMEQHSDHESPTHTEV